jgi:hypothetical protein
MLPKLRIILVAVLATCAAVLALSAGMLGARTPGDDLTGVPEVSRTLMRQAIVADPDPQLQVLAYSRRADELLRLRDLPVTPVRAVVEYAEHAQARSESAPAAPAVTPAADSAVASASVATPPADAPQSGAARSASAASSPIDTLPVSTAAPLAGPPAEISTAVANAPVAAPSADTPSTPPAAPVAVPAVAATTAAPTPVPAPAASGDSQVATVQTGTSETAEMYGPEKPKTEGTPHHRAKAAARPHPAKPKKKAQVAVAPTRDTQTPSTGFAANPPDNRTNTSNPPNNRDDTFGGWRPTNNHAPR